MKVDWKWNKHSKLKIKFKHFVQVSYLDIPEMLVLCESCAVKFHAFQLSYKPFLM